MFHISLISSHCEKPRRDNLGGSCPLSCSFRVSPGPSPGRCAALARTRALVRGVRGRGLQAQPRPRRKVAVTCCGRQQERTAFAPEPPGPRNCGALRGSGGRKHSLAHTYSDRKPGLTPSLEKVGPGAGGYKCGVLLSVHLPQSLSGGRESRRCDP